jgi:transposase InsO family protein
MQEAEVAILRFVQHEAFQKEITALQRCTHEPEKITISKSSKISNLDPVLGDDGLLRVGGRLRNAPIAQEAKHPVILPSDCHISSIIIRHIHEAANHQGRNQVLAEVRQRYWIVKANAAVRKVVRRCVTCRKYQAKSGVQKMADLPACRLQPNEPAFLQTGVDYFGPLLVKVGRTTRKRYGVLFTCFTSRAIHLEVAENLDTSSCINAIRRFIARRGPVKELHSDNGTNFVGANNELKLALQEINQETIGKFASNHGFQWSFNVPAASHHGGAWERQIRTVRKILHALLSEQHIKVTTSDEQLYTLLCEVEMTVNNRPLTKVSDDPLDLDVLTPNHLLHLKSPETLSPGTFNDKDIYAKRRWRQVQYLADIFWKRWVTEYLHTLQKRQKWLQPNRNLKVGDIVLIVDNTAPRNSWPMGRVEQVNVGSQGHVRSASVKTKSAILTRPITKLCLILEAET